MAQQSVNEQIAYRTERLALYERGNRATDRSRARRERRRLAVLLRMKETRA